MRLKDVEIKNFRLLSNLTRNNNVHIDPRTTLIVGKNNSGKTSFSHIFERFLMGGKFDWEDFSLDCHSKFRTIFEHYLLAIKDDNRELKQKCYEQIPYIEMILTIEYTDQDNWSNIRPLLTTLDDSNTLKISFLYTLERADQFFEHLHKEYNKNVEKDIIEHISKLHSSYFKLSIRPYSTDTETIKVSLTEINKIIGTCFIAAQREVDDGNSKSSSKLSSVFQKEYRNRSIKFSDITESGQEIEALKEEVFKANSEIDQKLEAFFDEFIRSYSKFGYPNMEDTTLILKSNMTVTNLFHSIKLFYKDNEHLLPEKYNGLGYSNLIYIISEILSFKSLIQENGTDLNLIFIEEPEAHMHPQLQSILIQRISTFLEENQINAQIIITTHSSHIVSSSTFESIRYFLRKNKQIVVKDMMKFTVNKNAAIQDEEENTYDVDTLQFLKRYITLVKCDMFFADKIVMVEGLCERLLMPLFFEKLDVEISSMIRESDQSIPIKILSEQYISLIEVSGAYMHKFREFLEFLEVKTLIITDIDCCKQSVSTKINKDGSEKKTIRKCEVKEEWLDELVTTNPTLKEWLPGSKYIKDLLNIPHEKKIEGNIAVTYQNNSCKRGGIIKCGRTFEEAFLIDNAKFIFENKDNLSSIAKIIKDYSNYQDIIENSYNVYEYIDKNDKKSNFAFDLMYLRDWEVPSYIKEGLLWLAK
ncbi:MAG TPA: AAA family ATPase [Bacillus sp. (in: firmicutes)]|uniref:AAA family ATPase n=1 Tax=Paenibacillus ehimensis TaxID=79264 RepID=UPI002C4C6653|nr:AAA family ATPase [Paenibacillus ehimensis]MEC0209784.1 AAA family ATPase [Paenibacillus ehimensis]HWO78441.1 AAA family ATPase [Bacillus sp. (in: firmicutes)]